MQRSCSCLGRYSIIIMIFSWRWTSGCYFWSVHWCQKWSRRRRNTLLHPLDPTPYNFWHSISSPQRSRHYRFKRYDPPLIYQHICYLIYSNWMNRYICSSYLKSRVAIGLSSSSEILYPTVFFRNVWMPSFHHTSGSWPCSYHPMKTGPTLET